MTKAELVEEVSRVSDLTKKHSEVIVDTVFQTIVDALHRGEKIELRGFGSFRLRKREPRKGRNLKTGEKVEGYIFDRRTGKTLLDSAVRLYPRTGNQKLTVSYADIAALAFSGKDTAAGKSWEAWMKRYREKKAAGETNIGLHPEALD